MGFVPKPELFGDYQSSTKCNAQHIPLTEYRHPLYFVLFRSRSLCASKAKERNYARDATADGTRGGTKVELHLFPVNVMTTCSQIFMAFNSEAIGSGPSPKYIPQQFWQMCLDANSLGTAYRSPSERTLSAPGVKASCRYKPSQSVQSSSSTLWILSLLIMIK